MEHINSRQDFISVMFCNGEGLTLNQIESLENKIAETLPEGMMKDIENEYAGECTEEEMRNMAMCMGYDNFLMSAHDNCGDMLTLRDFFQTYGIALSDMQVYRVFHLAI